MPAVMEPECGASDLHVSGEQENMNDMMTSKDRRLRGREKQREAAG